MAMALGAAVVLEVMAEGSGRATAEAGRPEELEVEMAGAADAAEGAGAREASAGLAACRSRT